MKKISFSFCTSILLIILFCFVQCKKEHSPVNITLYDKPLSQIQAYTNGNWKLQYAYGGISPAKYPAKHNSYMTLDSDRVIFGDDSSGVIVDTIIYWKRYKDIFNDSTYLLSYYHTTGNYTLQHYYIVDRINNDTLVLIENAYDGFYYYYTK